MLIHLHGKKVAHLSGSGKDVVQKGDTANHIFQRVTVFKIAYNQTHPSLILTEELDTGVLDSIVINDQCSALDRRYHSQGKAEEILHSTLTYLLQQHIIFVTVNITLLVIRFKYYLEIGDDDSALQ